MIEYTWLGTLTTYAMPDGQMRATTLCATPPCRRSEPAATTYGTRRYAIAKSKSPIGMRNVSPAVTAAVDDRSSEPRNVPPVDAVHIETCEYVSVFDTDVHSTAAVFEIAPDDAAAPNVAC